MENNIKIFENPDFGKVRVLMKGGEPWFVAKDVCDVLEIGNSRQALSRLDEDEKNTVILNDGTPGNPEKSIVNEPGLYSLVLSSRKPEAKEFKRWLTHDVIPSIRKTGGYGLPDFSDPVVAARAWADAMEEKQLAQAQVKELAPKAAITEAFIEKRHAVGFRDLAKELGVKETVLREFLPQAGIAYRQGGKWKPYADMTRKGFMIVKDIQVDGFTAACAFWTMEGKEYVRQGLLKLGLIQPVTAHP